MNDKHILVIGSGGQLGTDVCKEANAAGYKVTGIDFPHIDICNETSVERWVRQTNAPIVINCSAYTNVDNCETEHRQAYAVNAEGAGYIATACSSIGARMVHISTDYIFSGDKIGPYIETDSPDPKSIYGKSKLEGERNVAAACANHQIFRIAWLYGLHGKNFVFNIRAIAEKKAATNDILKVVNDQIGTPTSTREVCRQIIKAQPTNFTGIFHATCEGSCSWFDFATAIVTAAVIPVTIHPCTTEEFPRPAPRPRNSVLENKRCKDEGIAIMADWRQAFDEFLRDEATAKGK